jgi:hypothetical protein
MPVTWIVIAAALVVIAIGAALVAVLGLGSGPGRKN